MTQKTERRNYFRINDTVGLAYSVLADEETSSEQDSFDQDAECTRTLAEINIRFNQATNTVWQESPAIAEALGLLNKKISIIAESLSIADTPGLDSCNEKTVSISGCGMAFPCAAPLPVDTRLCVKVVLKPSNIDLHFIATVVACEHLSNNRAEEDYLIRIEIDDNNDTVREQLVQHVVQKQFEAKE